MLFKLVTWPSWCEGGFTFSHEEHRIDQVGKNLEDHQVHPFPQHCCLTSAFTPYTQGCESINPALDPNPRSCLHLESSLVGREGEQDKHGVVMPWVLLVGSSEAELALKSLLRTPSPGKD